MEIKVIKDDIESKIFVPESGSLSEALIKVGITIPMPCGGGGKCGKCTIKIKGSLSEVDDEEKRHLTKIQLADGYRLACRTKLIGDAVIEIQADKKAKIQTDFTAQILNVKSKNNGFGVAIDIGTTTIAGYLYNLTDGVLLQKASMLNPQIVYGADVISRIEKSINGQKDNIAKIVRDCIDKLIISISAEYNPSVAVITGNTAMLYFLSGRNVNSLSSAPFEADCLFGYETDAVSLGLSSIEKVYLPTCIAAFAGADLSCAVLAADIYKNDKNILLIDIGTNGEVYLNTKDKSFCCSAAAGPAFEGSGILMGMNAVEGAISKVWAQDGKLEYEVIGQKESVGICGSGLLDAVAIFLELGCIDNSGLIKASCAYFRQYNGERCFKLNDNVIITQSDIRALQLAKGAIRAAVDSLLAYADISIDKLDSIVIAGGFGSAICVTSAVRIGLLPPEAINISYAIGNAAAAGAARMLVDDNERNKVADIAKTAHYIELSGNELFTEHFINSINFPTIFDK